MYYLSKILFKHLSNYLFLIPLLAIASIAAWEDFKYGKIRNKWIKIGFLWGFALFSFFILWDLSFWLIKYFKIASPSVLVIKPIYFREVFLNTGLAFLVGFLMWRWNIWSAGDAKLFTLFALLLPLKFYSKTYLSYFPSFALLLNIFCVALAVFLITLIWTFLWWVFIRKKEILTEEKKIAQRKVFKKKALAILKETLNLCVIFFVMVSFLGILFRSPIGKNLTYFFTVTLGLERWAIFIILLGGFIFLMRFLRKIRKIFYAIAIILFIWLIYKWILFGESPLLTIRSMLGTTAIIIFGGFTFRKMFDWYVKKKEIKKIKPEELKKGMRLTEETLNTLRGKDKKDKISFKKTIGRIYPDGLTKKQIPLLKEFIKRSALDRRLGSTSDQRGAKPGSSRAKRLEIYKPSPFAIWMLAGLIITIILKGAVIQPLLK